MTGSIVVVGDSLIHYGPEGGLPAGDPRIWPTLVGKQCGREVRLFARIGWTSRDVWWAMTQDPALWAALGSADVLVVAVSGMDSLPSPLPTALRESIRYLRPERLRRVVRSGYAAVQPVLSPLGWPTALPPKVTAEYLGKICGSVRYLNPDLPVVLMVPSTHIAPSYGAAHPARAATERAVRAVAAEYGLPVVDPAPITTRMFAAGGGNPDGIHWDFAAHAEFAAVVSTAVENLLSDAPAR